MHAIIEKTIHFNCPMCHRPVETLASAAGKLISCPSCGREFDPPNPAPKASLSLLVLLGAGLFAALLIISIPVQDWAARRTAWSRTHETPSQLRQRFLAEADTALSQQCTIAIIGLRTIVTRDLRLTDTNPAKWSAEVTADYINSVGGVERLTLPFRFWTYHSPVDGRDHVLCSVDRLKISQAEDDALARQFGLTSSTASPGK